MGRKPLYSTAADRQKAYRERLASRLATQLERPPKAAAKKRKVSRPARLKAIIDATQTLLDEYENWRDSLPESLTESDQGEALNETIDLLEQIVELLDQVQPPLGYGRPRN